MSVTVWHDLFPLGTLKRRELKAVTVAGREIVLGQAAAGLFAVDNLCTHAEARLSEGYLRGNKLVCPLHGGAYDVRTGGVLEPPCLVPVRAYPLRITEGRLEVGIEE